MNKIMNSELGLKMCGGYIDIYKSVVLAFQEEIERFPSCIQTAYNECNWKELEVRVHGMKNSAATVGAVRLAEYAKNIENLLHVGQTDQMKEKLEALMRIVDQTREVIEGEVK